MPWRPDIFEFIDYRAFLRAYYDAAKENLPKFSYRAFAENAGFSSQSFLRDVMRGDKNIGSTGDKFASAMKLTKPETAFFDLLIAFDQAQSRIEKNELFEKIASTKRFRDARRIDEGMYRYLTHWYYPAIREMVVRDDFQNDPDWIAQTLNPSVSPKEVREAIDVLLDLGFVIETSDRTLIVGDPTITTGHEVTSLGVVNYHHEMLRLAGESIERFPSTKRDLGAMTICVREDQLPDLKKKIHQFREEVLNFADADEGGDTVVQFNTQLFPLTKVDS